MNLAKIVLSALCVGCIAMSVTGCSNSRTQTKALALGLPHKDGCETSGSTKPIKGRDHYYCTDTTLIGTDSYCLRDNNHDDWRHVRTMITPQAIEVASSYLNGSGKFEDIQYPNSKCTVKDSQGRPIHLGALKKDDRFRFTQIDETKGTELLEIYDQSTAHPGQLSAKIPLTPYTLEGTPWDKINNNKPIFFYEGTNPQDGLDYFVMHADKNKGMIEGNADIDAASIERFFIFEVYQSRKTNLGCDPERPDQIDTTTKALANFRPYSKTDPAGLAMCTLPPAPSQPTTGGGGHDQP